MAEAAKFNGKDLAQMADKSRVPIAQIANVNGVDLPAAGTPPASPTDLILSTP